MIRGFVRIKASGWHPVPDVCGQFIENMGENIYGGLWNDALPPDKTFLGGIRRDVLEATKALKPSLIRFPGGLAADYYHWMDGVGPRNRRPIRPNYAWRMAGPNIGVPEYHKFGTDEFMEFCRYVGAEPMLTVNVGTGSPREAAAWVEYCNGGSSTTYGSIRVENGYREPWNVKIWCVGNEQWLPQSKGSSSPEKYGRKFIKYARAMRKVDSDIKLVACGLGFEWGRSATWANLLPSIMIRPLFEPLKPFFNPSNWRDWNERLLRVAGEEIDLLSIHDYFPDTMKLWGWRPEENEENFYWIVSGNLKSEQTIRRVSKQLACCEPKDKKIRIAFDEWNVRYDLPSHRKANFNVADGIYCGCMLNSFLRAGDHLYCANFAQLVNALGMIITTDGEIFCTPTGHVFKIYCEALLERIVPCNVESQLFYTEKGKVVAKYLDVAATSSEGGDQISIYLINRSYDSPIDAEVVFEDFPCRRVERTSTLGSPGPFEFNTPDNPERVKVERDVVKPKVENESLTCVLPPHTVNCIQLG